MAEMHERMAAIHNANATSSQGLSQKEKMIAVGKGEGSCDRNALITSRNDIHFGTQACAEVVAKLLKV